MLLLERSLSIISSRVFRLTDEMETQMSIKDWGELDSVSGVCELPIPGSSSFPQFPTCSGFCPIVGRWAGGMGWSGHWEKSRAFRLVSCSLCFSPSLELQHEVTRVWNAGQEWRSGWAASTNVGGARLAHPKLLPLFSPRPSDRAHSVLPSACLRVGSLVKRWQRQKKHKIPARFFPWTLLRMLPQQF